MKILKILSIFILSFFIFCGCDKNTTASASSSHEDIAYEIEQIKGVENFSDETIKALSVIIRTNQNKNSYKQKEYSLNNPHILELVKETSGEIINKKDNTPIYYSLDTYKWNKEIKKSEILKFLKNKNIRLANIASTRIIKNKNGQAEALEIGNNIIDIDELVKEFSLESSKITNFNITKSSILIQGEGIENSQNFNIKESENLANNGISYNDILDTLLNNKNT